MKKNERFNKNSADVGFVMSWYYTKNQAVLQLLMLIYNCTCSHLMSKRPGVEKTRGFDRDTRILKEK